MTVKCKFLICQKNLLYFKLVIIKSLKKVILLIILTIIRKIRKKL